MKNKTRISALLILAFVVVLGFTYPIIRQNTLNRRLLDAIQTRQDAAVVHDLIQQGANPNAVGTSEYDTALLRAIYVNSPQTIKVLLDAGASVQPIGEARATPMIAVAMSDDTRVYHFTPADDRALIQQLRNRGESLEERDSLGFTPLMRAVWTGNIVTTKILLDMGADTHVVNNYGQTILYWVDNDPTKQAELVKLLHKHDASTWKS